MSISASNGGDEGTCVDFDTDSYIKPMISSINLTAATLTAIITGDSRPTIKELGTPD